jgi:hypothetical protein
MAWFTDLAFEKRLMAGSADISYERAERDLPRVAVAGFPRFGYSPHVAIFAGGQAGARWPGCPGETSRSIHQSFLDPPSPD